MGKKSSATTKLHSYFTSKIILFLLIDFDGDDYLGRRDLEKTINKLVAPQQFKPEDMEVCVLYILLFFLHIIVSVVTAVMLLPGQK